MLLKSSVCLKKIMLCMYNIMSNFLHYQITSFFFFHLFFYLSFGAKEGLFFLSSRTLNVNSVFN